jgi:hypothetical protein
MQNFQALPLRQNNVNAFYKVIFFYKQLPMSKLIKKSYCATLKCTRMDQLYNNFNPIIVEVRYVHFTSRTFFP